MISFNSSTHKLSDDTPYAYSTVVKTKFRFLGLYKGSIRGHIGGQEGQTAKTWFHSTLLHISFRMIPRMPIVLQKTKISIFGLGLDFGSSWRPDGTSNGHTLVVGSSTTVE